MKRDVTKKRLADCFMKLAEKKDVSKITVREIAEQSNVSSQTFYNYFQDKYELILWIYSDLGSETYKQFIHGEIDLREFIYRCLNFYDEYARFMVNILNNTHGTDSFWRNSSDREIRGFERFIIQYYGEEALTDEIRVHIRMFAYGCTEIASAWLQKPNHISPEILTEYIISFVPDTLRKYLTKEPEK
ncbi:MAG: TetR family transcriptional regulator [Solobacterium sp.]|nr:TetR family transcriptional regulator [Solobacterium sp.]